MTSSSDQPNGPENEEESFAALLDQYSPKSDVELRIGDKIRGKIISIGEETIFVDTGTKIDASVERADLLDENGELACSVGDSVELYVVAASESEIRLSKAITGAGGLDLLKEAHAQGIPVEGRVQATCKGGFHIELMQRRAFCPISQIDRVYVEDPESYVGEKFQFVISRIASGGRNIVVSRRQLLERELAVTRKAFLESLSEDQVLEGQVTRIQPFGAFVELVPGVEGLVHISELSWSRNIGVEDTVRVGDRLTVKVLGIEKAEDPRKLKISLSVKQLSGDPWLEIETQFEPGQKVQGTVTRCAKFGAFVEVAPGIEGLVHISELTYTRRVTDPAEIVTVGDTVPVVIKDIDAEKRRLALSIRDAEGDPWVNVEKQFSVGQTVEGRLERKQDFGYFINLAPGITGLLPKSLISRSPMSARVETAREGDKMSVVIESINPAEHKITLMPGDPDNERNWQQFSKPSPPAMGSLGEKLQQALSKRKD
jgi:small subunit ribosomal protein S1